MTRNDYKRKFLQMKTPGSRILLAGALIAAAGFFLAAAGVLLSQENKITFRQEIFFLVAGGGIALIGILLDLIGEILTSRDIRRVEENGRFQLEKAGKHPAYTLENQDGILHRFTQADITNYLEEMFWMKDQFVILEAPKSRNGIRFVQACQVETGVQVQLGMGEGKLVSKVCSQAECHQIFADFHKGVFRPVLGQYREEVL